MAWHSTFTSKTHGMRRTRVYRIWTFMMQRCYNPNRDSYQYYGGRGIVVCQRWHCFENFLEDMGEPPAAATLDRKDSEKGYSKQNCRWASRSQQMRNTRRTVYIEADGERLSLPDWADRIGVKQFTMRARLRSGWTAARIVNIEGAIFA